MQTELIRQLNEALRQHSGGKAVIWDLLRFRSVLVVAICPPDSTTPTALLDCIGCTHVSYIPSWQPVKIQCELQNVEYSPLRVVDHSSLRVDCKTARLTIAGVTTIKAAESDKRFFASPIGLVGPMELIAGLCERKPQSFSELVSYFHGYSQALSEHYVPWDNTKPSLPAFREWVKLKLGWNRTTSGWEQPIMANYPNDKEAAEQFCKLHSEFLREYTAGNVEDPPPADGYRI